MDSIKSLLTYLNKLRQGTYWLCKASHGTWLMSNKYINNKMGDAKNKDGMNIEIIALYIYDSQQILKLIKV